jgi:ADP-ribose pyrophosphatase YjhB (NUDIX family)
VRDLVQRWAYRAASSVLAGYRFVFRPTVRGVRCVLTRGGEVLLVRHTYGDRRWALPGGLIRRREAAELTARREMREELGLDIAAWRALGSITFVGTERARHVVECLSAAMPDEEIDMNRGEIAELAWFPLDELPDEALEQTDEIVALARRG